MAQQVDTHTVHTIHIDLIDSVMDKIQDGDEVRIVLHSRAQNLPMVPIKLSYTTINRRTRDR